MRLILLSLLLAACEGPAGPQGASGSDGSQGPAGEAGIPGESSGPVPWLTGPGVAIEVTNLAVSASAATVSFTLTDGHGVAVDPSGTLTTGTVELGFVLAQLALNADGSPAQYTAYTTEVQTSALTGASATQATTESNGMLHVIDVTQGTYT